MKKEDKSTNLEVARVLLIQAQNLIQVALDKVYLTGPSGIDAAGAINAVVNATCIVVYLQNKLKDKS